MIYSFPKLYLTISAFVVLNISFVYAQEKIELIHANKLKYDRSINENFKILTGEVKLKHENIIFECDSALLFDEENRMDAFGNINITKHNVAPDKFNIKGNTLRYQGNNKLGFIEGNVMLKDEDMLLTTDKVDYIGVEDIITYNNWANITDKTMKLNSRVGRYNIQTKDFLFVDNVKIIDKEMILTSDSISYNYSREIMYIISKTKIILDSSTTIYSSNGWFENNTENAQLNYQNLIITDNKTIQADSIRYYAKQKEIICKHNANINDTSAKICLKANYIYMDRQNNKGFATIKSHIINYSEEDTTFIKGDTIKFFNDSITEEWEIKVEGNTKSFKTNMQSISDTLLFLSSQNCVYMTGNPHLWLDTSTQITCNGIEMQFDTSNNLQNIYFISNPFIISKDTSRQYNQIKGMEMFAVFKNNELNYIDVYDNAESIYYVKDSIYTVGINKVKGDTIVITFAEDEVKQIFVKNKTTANFISPLNAKNHNLKLKGFAYFPEKRPKSKKDIID